MSATQDHNAVNKELPGSKEPTHRRQYDYGGNPQFHANDGDSVRLPAFGGDFQPGLYKVDPNRKFANPAPLGLCGFALTTFVLALVNLGTNGLTAPNIVVGSAFAYGGLCQLLAGMWDMAIGNTFGATAFSSYGGFWIATAIVLTPGGFEIIEELGDQFTYSFGIYLMGWFIFTFILLLCTLKSTVAFFFLFFTLDMAFLLLGLAYIYATGGEPNVPLLRAGGAFAILAAFAAWYNAFAGLADPSNSFFLAPVVHFPWSAKGREQRGKTEENGDKLA